MNDHEPYCDQNHTPRQRCNRALEPVTRPANRVVEVPAEADAPAVPSAGGADDAQADPLRDAVATAEIAAPTAFVTREWSKTAAAVEDAHRPSARPPSRPIARERTGPPVGMIALGIGLALLLLLMRRRRRLPSDG